MEPSQKMTPRERLIRAGCGVGFLVLGCVIFALSKAYDPANRAALLAIIAIFVGLTWIGQAARGHKDLVPHPAEEADPEAQPEVAVHTTALGLILAWMVPGLGHWLIGRRKKAVLFFTVITVTFFLGVLLAQGRNLSYDRDRVYFLAYVWNLGETGFGWLVTRHLEYDKAIPHLQVGFLYAAVASLLNLVVVIDFFNTCTRKITPGRLGQALETVAKVERYVPK